jgi:hypothetical protein
MGTAEQFKQTGYIVIKNIIDTEEAANFYGYALKKMDQGNMDDGQVPGSPSFYQDKEMVKLQQRLLPLIEEAIQLKIFITYCYHRVYRTGAVLRAHKDKSVCKVAATLNLGQKGELWDIWLIDRDENPRQITLAPGDILVYRGNQLTHMRGRLVKADLVAQLLLFFVEKNESNIFAVKIEQLKTAIKKFIRRS